MVIDRLSSEALTKATVDALTPADHRARWGRESWHMRPERSWTTCRRKVARAALAP